MKPIKKSCPTCKTTISVGLFSNREELFKCSKCGNLLMENPKRKNTGTFIFFLGLVLGLYISIFYAFLIGGLLIILIAFVISILISRLIVVKRDLVIKNKQTNEVSYINSSDWDEIVRNSYLKENYFEIIERFK